VSQKSATRPHFLGLNELRPAVHLAGCYHFKRNVWFDYRIPSHHLILIESGRIEAKTKDGSFEAKSGDLVCFRPAEWNQYGTHTPTLFYQAHVEFAGPPRHKLTPFLEGIGALPVRVPLGEHFAEMRRLFETLCLEITHNGIIHQLRMRGAMYEILAIAAAAVGPGKDTVPHLDQWLRVQQRLDSNLSQDLRIEELARQMGLSTEHFIRQFKQHFGISPKAYHTRARLQEAARSLRGTEKSIKSIAYSMGFSDPKSFTRRFKQHLGVKPSDLRLTAPSDAAEACTTSRTLFPLNVHLLPPQTTPVSFKRYFPKGKGTIPAPSDHDKILDKLSHPEKYV
jgi:AraC-like DNA-binding protein